MKPSCLILLRKRTRDVPKKVL